MSADSLLRRATKHLLARTLPEPAYVCLRALVAAWDITSGRWGEPEVTGEATPTGMHTRDWDRTRTPDPYSGRRYWTLKTLPELALWPHESALDLGAHFGGWSYHLAGHLVGPGRVVAFEPIPSTAAVLRQTLRLLRWTQALGALRVQVRQQGVGECPGMQPFRVPLQASGLPAAGQSSFASRHDARPGRSQHVTAPRATTIWAKVVRLDDVIDLPSVALIKADLEGAELFALRGATRLLETHHPTIVCEINPWFLAGFGLTVCDLTDFLGSVGYAMYRFLPDRVGRPGLTRPTFHLVPWVSEAVIEANYVFVHPSRAARFGLTTTTPVQVSA